MIFLKYFYDYSFCFINFCFSYRVPSIWLVLFPNRTGLRLPHLSLKLEIEVLLLGPELKVKTKLMLVSADFVQVLAKTFKPLVEKRVLRIFVSRVWHMLKMSLYFCFHSFHVGLRKGSRFRYVQHTFSFPEFVLELRIFLIHQLQLRFELTLGSSRTALVLQRFVVLPFHPLLLGLMLMLHCSLFSFMELFHLLLLLPSALCYFFKFPKFS